MMKTRALLLSFLTLGLVSAAAAGTLGTTFTYQGILADAGSPVSGVVDLRFALWDAATGGAQVGAAVAIDATAVTGGRVTVPLDFGTVFNGNELWLAVEVRDVGSGGAYTLLDPRQALTAAPFAAHAIESQTAGSATTAAHASTADSATTAGSATTASESDTLDGQHGSYYREWSNLTGKPAGLDDGDDDTLADLSCSSGEVATWNGSSWACASPGGSPYSRTVVVGPVGDAVANGAALFSAMNSLSGVASAADGILVQVEPGEYDLAGANFMVWDWVYLRGAGRLATRIYSEACGPVNRVVALGNGELSDLTIENTCSDPAAHIEGVSIGSMSDGARISRINVVVEGTTDFAWGIYNGGSDVFMEDFQVSVSGAQSARGVGSWAPRLFLIDAIVHATGVDLGIGLDLTSGASVVTSRGNYSGSGATTGYGLKARGASVDANDTNFEGDDGAIRMYGTDGEQSGYFTRVDAHGQVYVWGDGVDDMVVRIRHSRVSDSTNTIVLIPGIGTVRVSGSELAGGPVIGAVQCVAVWDEGTGFYPNTCP
jgi:hypothetical protein